MATYGRPSGAARVPLVRGAVPVTRRRRRRRCRLWLRLASSSLLLLRRLRGSRLRGSRLLLLGGNRLLHLLHLLSLRFRLLRFLCHVRPPDRLANGPTLMPALE